MGVWDTIVHQKYVMINVFILYAFIFSPSQFVEKVLLIYKNVYVEFFAEISVLWSFNTFSQNLYFRSEYRYTESCFKNIENQPLF